MFSAKLPGVHVPHRKNTQSSAPVAIPVPPVVTIPMSMHIGAPASVSVKVGQHVKTGEPIGTETGFVSAAVYASVTGTVKKIEPLRHIGGAGMAVTIESAETQEIWENLQKPVVENTEDFIRAVRQSGVVGLGGAGFPTAVKLSVKDLNAVDAFIINGADCEPYITSDTQTMLNDAAHMMNGIALLEKYMKAKKIIIGIENNKPQCIQKMQELTKNDPLVQVKALPALYPQGGEKVLIYHTTGRIVPEGKLPLDVGVIVLNCTTLAAIARYIETGMPLIEKCVTVDGDCVKTPMNVLAPIGTPAGQIFEFCGGFVKEPKKLLYGGPMMGITMPDDRAPVLKNTNAILALSESECPAPVPGPCLRCGKCVEVCPLHLLPCELEHAFDSGNTARLEKLKINLCMECGCCSYVCPSSRPLVQKHKMSKALLRSKAPKK